MSLETAPQENYEQKSLFKLPHERPDDVSDAEWDEHLAKRNSGYYTRINDWLDANSLGATQPGTTETPTAPTHVDIVSEPSEPSLVPVATEENVRLAGRGDQAAPVRTAEQSPYGPDTWGARVEAMATRISNLSSTADRLQQSKDEMIAGTKRVAKKAGKAALITGGVALAVPTLAALSPFIATGLAGYGTYKAGKAAARKTKEVAGAAKDTVVDVYENNAYKVENQARRMRIGLGRAALLRFAPGYLTGQVVAKSAEWTQSRAAARVEANRTKQENSRAMKTIDKDRRRIEENKARKSRNTPEQRAA
jgi:hypothetical protein